MKVVVWDVPTRVFHWLFAVAIVVAWLSGEPDRFRDVHVFAGYLVLGLLVFRIAWGFVGSRYARFNSFCFSPAQALCYLRDSLKRSATRYLGHNPAGAWVVYFMLLLALLATISGMVVLGGEEQQGLFGGIVPFYVGEAFKETHELLANLIMVLAVVHVAGVIVESRLHHENLARSMVSGLKEGDAGQGITASHYVAGVVLLVLAAAFGGLFFSDYFSQTSTRPYLPFIGKSLPDHPHWREECGSCHLAFHPTLLPARSWAKIMEQQNDHFGESLQLDDALVKDILAFLQKNSAEAELTEAAHKILESIPPGQTPLRITETKYWIAKHDEIVDAVWSSKEVGAKSNCGACHLDAERGTFEDAAMRIPKAGQAQQP
ncbi:MAG: cytochrome b/b6 domain-containing protein [Pseudomonadota bacterium]